MSFVRNQEQLSKAFYDLRLLQCRTVGQKGIGLIEAGVESFVSEAMYHLADYRWYKQVAKGQIDRNYTVALRIWFVRIDKKSGQIELGAGPRERD